MRIWKALLMCSVPATALAQTQTRPLSSMDILTACAAANGCRNIDPATANLASQASAGVAGAVTTANQASTSAAAALTAANTASTTATAASTTAGAAQTAAATNASKIAAQVSKEAQDVKTLQQSLTSLKLTVPTTTISTSGLMTFTDTNGVAWTIQLTAPTSTAPVGPGGALGAALSLAASGSVVASIGPDTFSWANQANATTSGGGSSTLAISQPVHPGSSNEAALGTQMASGDATYTAMVETTDPDPYYNSGIVLYNQATSAGVVAQNIFGNNAGATVRIATQSDFTAANFNILNNQPNNAPPPNLAAIPLGSMYWLRAVVQGGNLTWLYSPTGLDSSWIVLQPATALSALGNPDHIGIYEDAASNTKATYNGVFQTFKFLATAGATPQAAVPGGDTGADFQIAPSVGNGWPSTNVAPVISGYTPKYGLALAAGAKNIADYTFPGSGASTITMPDSATLRKNMYLYFNEGNEATLIGSPQDNGQGGNSPFWSHDRVYTAGDPNDLVPVTSNGWKLISHCSGPNYSYCAYNQVRAGFGSTMQSFRPGMIMEVTYIPPTGYFSWAPIWAYSGQRLTPAATGNIYPPGGGFVASPNNAIEIDFNDNYPRNDYGGCPYGGQIDFSVPNFYGTSWTTPHMTYAANSGGWTDNNYGNPADATANNYLCPPAYTPGTPVTLLVYWPKASSPTTSRGLDEFVNGKRIMQAYVEYPETATFTDPDGTTQTVGLNLNFGGQAIPTFNNPPANILDNEGDTAAQTATHNLPWTMTILEIHLIEGDLANRGCCDAGTNAIANSAPIQ